MVYADKRLNKNDNINKTNQSVTKFYPYLFPVTPMSAMATQTTDISTVCSDQRQRNIKSPHNLPLVRLVIPLTKGQ